MSLHVFLWFFQKVMIWAGFKLCNLVILWFWVQVNFWQLCWYEGSEFPVKQEFTHLYVFWGIFTCLKIREIRKSASWKAFQLSTLKHIMKYKLFSLSVHYDPFVGGVTESQCSIVENVDHEGEKKAPETQVGHFRDILHFVKKEIHTHDNTDVDEQILK